MPSQSKAGNLAHKAPLVIGHRGSAGTVPENTITSFQAALASGADGLEADLRLSADGVVVVIHDPVLQRTTNGAGSISSTTIANLRNLNAGYWFTTDGGITYPFRGIGLQIPTLEELLVHFPSTPLYLDLKTGDRPLLDRCIALIEKYGRWHDATLLVYKNRKKDIDQSVKKFPLLRVGHRRPDIVRFCLLSRLRLASLFSPKAQSVQVPIRFGRLSPVGPRLVKDSHRAGIQLHIWTVDDEKDMLRYLKMGVDAIYTNLPGRLRALIDTAAEREYQP